MNSLPSVLLKYLKALLKPLAFIILYLSIYFAAQIAVTGVYSIAIIAYLVITGQSLDWHATYDIILVNTTTAVLISILLTLPIYFIIPKIRKQNVFEVLRFRKTGISNLGLSLILGASLNVFISYALVYLESIAPLENISKEYEQIMERVMDGNSIIVFITVGVMAPIIEEIIFRGLVLNELKKALPIYPAITLQALIFGIYHLNLIQGLYAALLGIVLGIVTEKTRSIWAPILIHISFNSLSTLINKVPINIPEGHLLSNQYFLFLSSIVFAALSFVLILQLSKRRSNIISE
ncbi:CPBP family intramembrane glutamic endopeptidase [Acetivibrio mesophilus]|uniref:CPBP family intramembrane metalloprotease n=1 Tax=Acetivibrio mesophilus TaxID=2487273 RepID=A0A4Q0I5T2_9FIRM|nr:type II CAAX endopeptidase family protein [Acetivibrio mesophilus]ODM27016.1 abortive infection protein [Clostridium sp. Bc-iso-3]RXE59237.1 CPBP family intramembrane metalloprotease [Acetivibrio mesophilus]HHV28823.1 CPBP family intramembrane metalloprotease [Clostridium sp.]